jgi:hypothetical protein
MPFSSLQQSLTGNQTQPTAQPPEPVYVEPVAPAEANQPPYQAAVQEFAPTPEPQVVEPVQAVPETYQPVPVAEVAPPQYQQPEDFAPQPTEPAPAAPQFTPEQLENILPSELRPPSEELVYEWTAPTRPFKRQDRQFYTTIGSIIFLISLILLFAGQFLTIAVVIAIGFLVYVMSAVPPEMVRHQITTFGLRTDQQLYAWEELGRFWITERMGQKVIHVEAGRFPNHLSLLVGDGDEAQLTEIFSQVLLNQEPPQTTFDRAAAWLQERFPIRS